ncbi:MAG: PAS-domain containing protein [Beijerinckiaceae bacterium]|nr:PAS-domain containing protein [Beijerinckiaceae bacterium]
MRSSGARCRPRLRGGFWPGAGIFAAGIFETRPETAWATEAAKPSLWGDLQNTHDLVGLSMFTGLVLFATFLALLYLAQRRRWTNRENALLVDLNEIRARLDRAETFLAAEPHIVVAWGLNGNEPEIEGDLNLVSDIPVARRLLGFGSWLPSAQAQRLESLVQNLRERGEAFRVAAVSLNGHHVEIEGRAVTGRAAMRIRDVSGDRLEAIRLGESQARVIAELDTLKAMLDAVPSPAWMRDSSGELDWVNKAYVLAVEAKSAGDVIARRIELLESSTRDASAQKRAENSIFRNKSIAVVAGYRRSLDIVEAPHEGRTAGFAADISELEAARIDLKQTMIAHARTLDQLSTAVATFDRRKQLVFHNAAYRQLWSLDQAFLDQNPTESAILDQLRAKRLLPEQADFRAWKEAHLAGYQSPDTSEDVWHLPDGRTLRAVVNPNPQSGVTYLFDDVTAQFRLESKFNAQTRVQGETLDTLKEGVAVFSTDGRLKLSNAAFARLWRIDPKDLEDKPHIDQVAELCAALCPDPESWNVLRTAVAGLHDQRTGIERRLTCRDGSIFDCSVAPLPDGATLLTFTDTTASVNVERALMERNQALIDTEKLRNDFVHHVSYELRTPLTNIIGFIQLLSDGAIGPLNPRQTEYTGYVMKSSAALLAIIDDILDLATMDAGETELHLAPVSILGTINAAVEGVQDRLAESALTLQIVASPDIGSFVADGKRVRQVLFNLLSNAIGFSAPGQTVTLLATRRGNDVVFKISDQGRGIPHDVIAHVFDRFHSNTIGSRHRGVGLGLSIVKAFVELHGGKVLINSAPGEGTTVTCVFPCREEPVVEETNAAEAGKPRIPPPQPGQSAFS